jgi:type VI protein secretion system component Hcp
MLFEKVAGGEPLEQVNLAYSKVKVSYEAQKQDGSVPSNQGFDILTLKPW